MKNSTFSLLLSLGNLILICVDMIFFIFVLGFVEFLESVCFYFLFNLDIFYLIFFFKYYTYTFVRDSSYKYFRPLEVVPLFANWPPCSPTVVS